MSEEIIKAIVYTTLDERLGPNPLLWFPLDLSENIRMGVSIKSITMLTTDQGNVPKSLVIIPFPSFNLKGIIKYIERKDNSRRGGIALSSIALLFNEADDLIFYKYMDYLETAFSESAKNFIELENRNAEGIEMYAEINNLRKNLTEILEDLRYKEKEGSELDAFPELEEIDFSAYHFKVIICGDPEVGKTSIVLRFTNNAFIRTYVATMGVSVSERKIQTKDDLVNIIFWDIAGQTKFALMRRHFYQGANGVILVFDLTNIKSYLNVQNWFNEIDKHVTDRSKLFGFLLGNKEDLSDKRVVNYDEAERLARSFNLKYIETSALSGKNITECLNDIAESLVSRNITKIER
ncbi:MAG: Rab family GTPase [Promethearchaeota archaeon]|jgi:Ras-related protein Rab-1A